MATKGTSKGHMPMHTKEMDGMMGKMGGKMPMKEMPKGMPPKGMPMKGGKKK